MMREIRSRVEARDPAALQQLFREDLRQAAIHEVGHAMVAKPYSVRMALSLYPHAADDPTAEGLAAGRVEYNTRTGTPTKAESAVGWAGLLAQIMDREATEDFELLAEMFEDESLDLSDSDVELVDSLDGRPRREAGRLAYEILRETKTERDNLARWLIADFHEHGYANAYWEPRTGWRDVRGRPIELSRGKDVSSASQEVAR